MAYLPFQTSAGILQEMPAKGITLFLILLNFGWWMRMCCLRRSRSRTRPTIKITTPAPGWGSWMRGRKTSEPTGTELSAPRTPATVDAESNTTTTLAMLSLLEDMKKSIDNSLQEHQAKSASTLAAAVKKEIAGLLNQRPPASVADIKAVSLEIQNVRSELDMVRSELTEMKKVLSDTHQSTLDARVEAKTEVDRLENTFISYDAKFDSEMAYINQRLDELHVKVDKTKDDIRDIHMIVPYQQNIQRVVDDILWHAEQISHGCRQMDESVGKALENTRTGQVPINLTSALRFKDLARLIMVVQQSQEYKERFLAVQGLLVVIKDHSAPLLRTVPDYLQQIQNHLDDIKDSFDEGVTKQMGVLETRLISFEQEFAMQRDKIPESINKQNQAVEKICISTTVSMTQTQNTIDNLATTVEELRTHVHDTNSMLLEMSRHFSATTIVIQQNQEAMNQKIDKVNGRLLSLRGMLEDRPTAGTSGVDAQTVALRSHPPDHREFWQVDMEYVEQKLQDWQVRYDMGQAFSELPIVFWTGCGSLVPEKVSARDIAYTAA
ncbi:hypothetical protein AK812_SmicGene2504 [Symbiodinium microadriaticum]|uniref:Uncharacterized protein n=1 Tax=Symbiodinium microadriaticum TaxID=2951 RepID=A0A1Q9F1E2_SYMMI|nr:hypothetical protein AK812_SmicGene2504 [Symbiodinium microadriaticum]